MAKFQVATLVWRDLRWFLTEKMSKIIYCSTIFEINFNEVEKLFSSRQFSNFKWFFVKLDSFSKTKALCRFPKRILILLKVHRNSENTLTCCNLTKFFFFQRFFQFWLPTFSASIRNLFTRRFRQSKLKNPWILFHLRNVYLFKKWN